VCYREFGHDPPYLDYLDGRALLDDQDRVPVINIQANAPMVTSTKSSAKAPITRTV
jgi:hypothetical protein